MYCQISVAPPWDEVIGKELIGRHTRVVVGEIQAPTFKEFVTASRRPLGKGAVADGIPRGTWQVLPYKVLWVQNLVVLWAWTEGTTPARWVVAKDITHRDLLSICCPTCLLPRGGAIPPCKPDAAIPGFDWPALLDTRGLCRNVASTKRAWLRMPPTTDQFL